MQDRAQRISWFKAEVLPHEPALRRYLGRVVRSREEVDDIVSEALASVYAADNWAEIANVRAYLFTIARNLVYDAVRRRRVVRDRHHDGSGQRKRVDGPPRAGAERANEHARREPNSRR